MICERDIFPTTNPHIAWDADTRQFFYRRDGKFHVFEFGEDGKPRWREKKALEDA